MFHQIISIAQKIYNKTTIFIYRFNEWEILIFYLFCQRFHFNLAYFCVSLSNQNLNIVKKARTLLVPPNNRHNVDMDIDWLINHIVMEFPYFAKYW